MVVNKIFPDIEQLRELPSQLAMAIPPEWEDRNGHVNVQFYLALYELGGWVVLEEVGIEELANALDRLINKHRRLSWAAPVCGLMKPWEG